MRKSLGTADVAVVGGGVAGLSAARELARRGLSVALFEGGKAGPASPAAAGMLAPQAEADHADDFFALLCASRDMYPAFAASLGEESGVAVEIDRTGTLYVALTPGDEEEAGRRFAWQARAGLEVERLTAGEARALEPAVSAGVRMALRFPRDWQVESRRLVAALASSAERAGARIVRDADAQGVRVAAGRAAGVVTPEGELSAGAVVFAAGAWHSRLHKFSGAGSPHPLDDDPEVEPVRGQILCFRQPDAGAPLVRHVVYGARGYVVPRREVLLAGATTERAGFDCRVTGEGAASVTANAAEVVPRVASLGVADSWAGLRPRAADGLPVLGESADVGGLFYATGFYRNGILLAPAAGEIVADLVTGRATKLSPGSLEAFSPARFLRVTAGPPRAL